MKEPAAVAVIVLNWNNATDTLECLASLAASEVPVDTIVVDNGSQDDSVSRIGASSLARHLLQTGANLGYAGGNNVGLRFALQQDYSCVIVLNNDTTVEPDSIARILPHLDGDRTPRAVSPRIDYAGGRGEVWFAGGVVDRGWPRHLQPDELRLLQAPRLHASETLSGCCIAARPETWQHVGLFDERYFLIFEDSDWSLRALRRGIELAIATDAVIAHKVSRSFDLGAVRHIGTYYFVRNGVLFHRRFQRRFLLRFVEMWVLRPTARAVLGRGSWRVAGIAWVGLTHALVCRWGKASPRVERWSTTRTGLAGATHQPS